ncbi:MAG: GNAT family N-acetyltransferase [Gemmatimonadetes bacterium]|nr:GNAT family N-acetyltransferase [Gemmatimonadota bacterium]
MHLQTPRLAIRPLTPDAVDPLASLWNDAEVTRYMGGPRDRAAVAASIRAAAEAPPRPYDLWPVYEKSTGRLAGHCGFLEKEVDGRAEIELVYVIARDLWGRGYATEAAAALRDHAFADLGVTRLIGLIEPGNTASARVAEKVGMVLERETVRPGGRAMQVWGIDFGSPAATQRV